MLMHNKALICTLCTINMLAIHAYKQLVNIENWPQSVIMLLRILIVKYIFSELFLLTNHLSSAKTVFVCIV